MDAATAQADRRQQVSIAVFSMWIVGGLFLDGWAHNAEKAETFWTPWHAVLYSGFLAAALWGAISRRRERAGGLEVPRDHLMTIGLAAFAVGGVSDMGWHTVFGVEEDLEALLSPTHLLLMVGGLLLTTAPLRAAWHQPDMHPRLPAFLPAVVSAALSAAVLGFFLQFSSPFHLHHEEFAAGAGDAVQSSVVLGFLVTTALLVGLAMLLLWRWRTPPGTLAVVFTAFALLMTGLHAFRELPLVLAALAAGAVGDVLVARGAGARSIGVLVPLTMWASWFAVYDLVWALGWAPELWTGTIVLSALTGFGLSLLAAPPALPATRDQQPTAELASHLTRTLQ
jgi:hypothetical protein